MVADQETPRLNLLQRLDLALATRVAATPPLVTDLTRGIGLPDPPAVDVAVWVSGLLGLRGLLVRPEDVAAVIAGEPCRFEEDRHEYCLISGLHRVHARMLRWRRDGRAPDGWSMVELFKEFTRDVPRFRNNQVRKDAPWDAILYVKYPDSDKLPAILDSFNRDNAYMDHSVRFDNLHPVRQSFRMMWHFARIAPFPDFNITMSWVAMNLYLLHCGYPMFTPVREDRERLHRMLTGPVPLRILSFETRLLDSLESAL
jgi:hypothetical protein